MNERYVVLGLAPARASWLRELARWSTAAAVPVQLVPCVSVEEARARIGSGRPFSALLVDGSTPGLDRDLLDAASARDCATVVIEGGDRDWTALGAAAVLAPGFDRNGLVRALAAAASAIASREASAGAPGAAGRTAEVRRPRVPAWRGRLVAVAGTGGTGTSTVAMALAQSLAGDVRRRDLVVLADLALDADHAVLHDVGDVVPGLPELVEACRGGDPEPEAIRALTWVLPERGYRLLLGLRRRRDWAAMRPRAVAASLEALRRSHKVVVAEVTGDFEGAAEGGSIDVEDRNALARLTARAADLLLVTGRPGTSGIHRLGRLIEEVLGCDVAPDRILPVINRAPRGVRARADITAALAVLGGRGTGEHDPIQPPLFLPERRQLELAVRDGHPMPASLGQPLARAVDALLDHLGTNVPAADADAAAEPVRPGSLAHVARGSAGDVA